MTLFDLRKMWEQTEKLPIKERRKAYRTASHVAVELGLNSNLELKDFDFCIDVIKTSLPTVSSPTATQNRLTKIYRKKLELMGIDDPEPVILSKNSGHVGIDSGTLMIADSTLLDDHIEDYRHWSQMASEGRAYFIATGGDGITAAQIRVIDFRVSAIPRNSSNVVFGCAPCEGGVFQWVRVPPGNFAPAGSNRSSHGGNKVAEASDVKGHFR